MKNKKAFTLVELLIVITIIGVLASLVIPAVAGMLEEGDKTKASSNGKQIAITWMPNKDKISGGTVHEWAASLAKASDGLNNAEFWILPSDPKVKAIGREMPTLVADAVDYEYSVNPNFEQFPLMWTVAANHPTNPISPLLWTRGLKQDGTWDEIEGVFGSEGGHIVSSDGSVKWYKISLKKENGEGELRSAKRGNTKPTFNIKEAIPATCPILNGGPDFQ